MMTLPAELILPVVTALASAGAIYGGIRNDLKSIHVKIQAVKDDADEAHRRLDRHLEQPARR